MKKIDDNFLETINGISEEIKRIIGNFVKSNVKDPTFTPFKIEEAGHYKENFFAIYDEFITHLSTPNWFKDSIEESLNILRMEMATLENSVTVAQQGGEDYQNEFSLNHSSAYILFNCTSDLFESIKNDLQINFDGFCEKVSAKKINLTDFFSPIFAAIRICIHNEIIQKFPYFSIVDDNDPLDRTIDLVDGVFNDVISKFLPLFKWKGKEIKNVFDSFLTPFDTISASESEESLEAIGKLMLLNWDNLNTNENFCNINSIKMVISKLPADSITRVGNFMPCTGNGLYDVLISTTNMNEMQKKEFQQYCCNKKALFLQPTEDTDEKQKSDKEFVKEGAKSEGKESLKITDPDFPDLLMIKKFIELTNTDIVIYYEDNSCRFKANNSEENNFIELAYNSLDFYRNLDPQ